MRKFLFDTAFSADGAVLNEKPPARPPITEADLETARAEGYAAGVADGRHDAAQRAAQLHAEALKENAANLRAMLSQIDDRMATIKAHGAVLAFRVGSAIAGAALSRFGEENAKALIAAAMEELRHAGRARLFAAPAIAKALLTVSEASEQPLASGVSFSCEADASMPEGAVRLEFGGAEMAFNPQEIADAIRHALSIHISAQDNIP